MISVPKALLATAFFIAAVFMAGDAQMANTRSTILFTMSETDPGRAKSLRRRAGVEWWRGAIGASLALSLAALGGTLLG